LGHTINTDGCAFVAFFFFASAFAALSDVETAREVELLLVDVK
jgi:hypothetical protein